VKPQDYDMAALAMQEPQYRSAGVRELLQTLARAKVPCMSIMNMPPLPYLKRIPGLNTDPLKSCYTDATVWEPFDPQLVTLCSPDPQAFRPPEEKPNVLQVTLPTTSRSRGSIPINTRICFARWQQKLKPSATTPRRARSSCR
jgi:hypothetical protein